ncbi:DUF2796 domain-containing protein [Photobacterium sp. TY1-4]|uniref:zinc uptake protein ZrgA n=1 Tax=Photobacterium sp. TY1-4 TaxID=2899122 RepID=UPI0021BEC0A9|nr:DUF2796 domain-containing protein [Photobacterium sp. TY1-4]UXI01032.1 DUF2796 domain-containing protein [Photobacterium sp. TY1-4]
MPSFRLSHCALMLGTLTFTQYAQADHHTYRQHDAHVHGVVEMNLAQDGQEVLLEITAPGADVVGFEHAPETPAQQQALKDAIRQLKQTNTLLALTPAAHCQLTDVRVEETLTNAHDDHDHESHNEHEHAQHDHEDHDHAQHDHEDHGEHDHAQHDHEDHDEHDHAQHDHEGHDDHDHDAHDHHEAHQHGEFSAQYTFHCDHIEQLSTMQVHWFRHFPNTEKMTVQAITDTRQKAAQLTPDQTTFTF